MVFPMNNELKKVSGIEHKELIYHITHQKGIIILLSYKPIEPRGRGAKAAQQGLMRPNSPWSSLVGAPFFDSRMT